MNFVPTPPPEEYTTSDCVAGFELDPARVVFVVSVAFHDVGEFATFAEVLAFSDMHNGRLYDSLK